MTTRRLPIELTPCPGNQTADRRHLWGREGGRKCTLCGTWRAGNPPPSRKPAALTVVRADDERYDDMLRVVRRNRQMHGTPDPQDPIAYLEGTDGWNDCE